MSDLVDLFDVNVQIVDGQRHVACRLDPALTEHVADLLAAAIATRRVGVNPRLHKVWREQRTLAPTYTINDHDQTLLIASVLENVGSPADPRPELHLNGLIAESLWLDVTTRLDTGLGIPIRTEGHDWSATDPGGDGLTVYTAPGGYAYRLWESKHHLAVAAVRETVNGACRQVRDRSLSYLARFSLIAQQLSGPDQTDLALFYGQLAELWVDRDPSAGVGISIGTDLTADTENCFANIGTYFGLDPSQHDGHLHIIGDYVDLAHRVRDELWKGCGLWTGP
jgi:hypothetical protein